MRITRKLPLRQKIDRFLYSPMYFLLIGGLTVLANIFCLEMYAYTGFILAGIYICLFGRDLLPLFPLFACGYISPSVKNNPGLNENSVFSFSGGGLYLAVLLILLAGCLVYRLVTDSSFGGKKFLSQKRGLLPSMLVLGICYAISGLGSGQWEKYGLQNLFFAFLQLVAIAGLYYLLSGGVLWEQAPKGYLFWTGICMGYLLVAELINIYITANVIIDGSICRDNIYTGWGQYNNMGALLAMCIPFAFYLTGKKRLAPIGYLTAFLLCLGLLFTCSRGSIIIGLAAYIVSYVFSVTRTYRNRSLIPVHIFIICVPILVCTLFWDELLWLYDDLVETGLRSPERMTIYTEGLRQFFRFPVFGGSFFPAGYWPFTWATSAKFVTIFPPRWHNTLIQLLATGGVTCLGAYAYHRYQTVKLFIRNFNMEKLFAGVSILALLLTSMLDCHFFNVGPVLVYSGILAFTEFQLNKSED